MSVAVRVLMPFFSWKDEERRGTHFSWVEKSRKNISKRWMLPSAAHKSSSFFTREEKILWEKNVKIDGEREEKNHAFLVNNSWIIRPAKVCYFFALCERERIIPACIPRVHTQRREINALRFFIHNKQSDCRINWRQMMLQWKSVCSDDPRPGMKPFFLLLFSNNQGGDYSPENDRVTFNNETIESEFTKREREGKPASFFCMSDKSWPCQIFSFPEASRGRTNHTVSQKKFECAMEAKESSKSNGKQIENEHLFVPEWMPTACERTGIFDWSNGGSCCEASLAKCIMQF